MNVFAKNKQFVVTGLESIIPVGQHRYSNVTGDIADLTAKLTQKNSDLAIAQAALLKNGGDITAIQNYIRTLLSGSPSSEQYTEANNQQVKIDTILLPEAASLKTKIDGIKTDIDNLKAQLLAANTLALHNANLSPSERAALEKQNADILASQNYAASRSKNIKILTITGAILLLLTGVGFIIYEVKKGKKSAATA